MSRNYFPDHRTIWKTGYGSRLKKHHAAKNTRTIAATQWQNNNAETDPAWLSPINPHGTGDMCIDLLFCNETMVEDVRSVLYFVANLRSTVHSGKNQPAYENHVCRRYPAWHLCGPYNSETHRENDGWIMFQQQGCQSVFNRIIFPLVV